ncbi:MAG: hypothetical protein ABSF29_11375 [Tepidisphaeraceae bacterium]|jgi:hypothetical protein
MTTNRQDVDCRRWPVWKRGLFYALYALAAAGAIELVDAKVHSAGRAGVAEAAAPK